MGAMASAPERSGPARPADSRGAAAQPMPRWLAWAGALLLILAGSYARVRDLCAPFDRGFEGFQGSFFALAAINYERAGFGAFGGYPLVNVALDTRDPKGWYTYENHPPTVAWSAWASARAFGPAGWNSAWQSERAPEGLEPALRLPFLIGHFLGLLAFFWLLLGAVPARQALVSLALLVACPLHVLYATLANYENPSLWLVLASFGCVLRWSAARASQAHATGQRDAPLAQAWLAGAALCCALGGATTFAPLFFLPGLAALASSRAGLRAGLAASALLGIATLAPLLVHGIYASRALASIGRSAAPLKARAFVLWQPLLDGSLPPWRFAWLQLERCWSYCSPGLVLAAALGLALALVPRTRRALSGTAAPALCLCLGGACVLLGYYKHAGEEQLPFLLNLAPGLAALGGLGFEGLGRWLDAQHSRGAAFVVCVAIALVPALLRQDELRSEWRAPGPLDRPAGTRGPALPLPSSAGEQLAELLPAGAIGVYPASLGFTPAASYYAWRTLLPRELAPILIERLHLERQPRYLVLPRAPWPACAAEVEALQSERAGSAPDLETADWRAWRL